MMVQFLGGLCSDFLNDDLCLNFCSLYDSVFHYFQRCDRSSFLAALIYPYCVEYYEISFNFLHFLLQ